MSPWSAFLNQCTATTNAPTLQGTERTREEGPTLWMVLVCVQMGRYAHWLPGPDLTTLALSQVSRHVRLSIVSWQQLPLQGARLLLKGTSRTLPEDQTSNVHLRSILVPVLLAGVTPNLQRVLHGEIFFIMIDYLYDFFVFLYNY